MMTLDQRKSLGMKWGTERLAAALTAVGFAGRTRYVHVAGTNGKGSVCRMTAAMLEAAGHRVGIFTSPSVTGLLDDIRINQTAVSAADFDRLAAKLTAAESADDPLSYFEVETGVALLYFDEQNVDVAVMECGLGGDTDATNVIPAPTVAVITAVSADHTDVLGDTVAAIARRKCGIIKPPCAVVTSPSQHPEALATILMTAAERGVTVHIPAAVGDIRQSDAALTFAAGGETYTLPVGGRFQADNAMLAVQTVRVLEQAGLRIGDADIRRGLADATFPCRQEFICRTPVRLMDGGHNPEGVAALADSLVAWRLGPMTAVVGMLADKDVAAAVLTLAPHIRRVVCCTPPNPRALPAERLAARFRAAGVDATAIDDPLAAWTAAEQIAGDTPLMVAGSFYLCAAIRPHLCERYKK